ncbi:DNA adenine methylase [Mycolicibacterium aubagnense]|uniref:site-specific DNA-methyltransferase (adenine-specific) n=1 Tax=Mycolicibacterium aubagnense TaxID=319707 RepID=A0ABN5Z163_9MYCO|nr:DNA adenine methylase [Mycolicibacterium aubagnense]TLH64259.1 DNA methyltransferase [Mycolicibacterium aubagnense]BBX87901.1 DNA methyltransferase [Mycolicibacterium aubagnense]
MPVERWLSPLRYPGGKGRMAPALAGIFEAQFGFMDIEIWVEPFAGGAGAGLHLLDRGAVSEVWLTEKNRSLAAFWRTVMAQGDELAAQVRICQPDMTIWHTARETVAAADNDAAIDDLELALAALVLNRCSRSGMVNHRVGPIGGKNQSGRWHLRSRWNGDGLAERIERIHQLGNQIRIDEGDAIERIAELDGSVGIEDELVLFVDPPYLVQGNRLYTEGMSFEDHKNLAHALTSCAARWLLTYDDDARILGLYPDRRILDYEIAHTANRQRVDEEFAVLSDDLAVLDDQALLPTGKSRWVQHAPVGGLTAGYPHRSNYFPAQLVPTA